MNFMHLDERDYPPAGLAKRRRAGSTAAGFADSKIAPTLVPKVCDPPHVRAFREALPMSSDRAAKHKQKEDDVV